MWKSRRSCGRGTSQQRLMSALNARGAVDDGRHETDATQPVQASSPTPPSLAGEMEVAARAAALREAALRTEVAHAEQRAQKAEQDLEEAKAAVHQLNKVGC